MLSAECADICQPWEPSHFVLERWLFQNKSLLLHMMNIIDILGGLHFVTHRLQVS